MLLLLLLQYEFMIHTFSPSSSDAFLPLPSVTASHIPTSILNPALVPLHHLTHSNLSSASLSCSNTEGSSTGASSPSSTAMMSSMRHTTASNQRSSKASILECATVCITSINHKMTTLRGCVDKLEAELRRGLVLISAAEHRTAAAAAQYATAQADVHLPAHNLLNFSFLQSTSSFCQMRMRCIVCEGTV
jgi:hypothetical protein